MTPVEFFVFKIKKQKINFLLIAETEKDVNNWYRAPINWTWLKNGERIFLLKSVRPQLSHTHTHPCSLFHANTHTATLSHTHTRKSSPSLSLLHAHAHKSAFSLSSTTQMLSLTLSLTFTHTASLSYACCLSLTIFVYFLVSRLNFVRSKKTGKGGIMVEWLAYLLPDPADVGSIPSVPEIPQRIKLSMLLRFINGSAKRKVNSGLILLIKPI